MKAFHELEKEFNRKQEIERAIIKAEPNKVKRFFKRVRHLFAFPWKWIWVNIRDWRTAVIFIIVFLVVSCEVWLPYLLGAIFYANEPFRISMFSIASACLVFWNLPGTPFLIIVIGLTMIGKTFLNKLKSKRTNHL